MSMLTKPSGAFPTSLIYITVGTLIVIWTTVSLILYRPATDWGHFLVIGTLVSGIAVLLIGVFLGPIGRAARNAELPPIEVTSAVAATEQTTAAKPPVIVPGAIPQGVVAPTANGHLAATPVDAGINR